MSLVSQARGQGGLPAVSRRSAATGRARRRVSLRLWIPATPILWLLAPIPLALAPLLYLVPPQVRPANPYAAVLALGRLLTAVHGTAVDVETAGLRLQLRIA
jgi:hypothetical protein